MPPADEPPSDTIPLVTDTVPLGPDDPINPPADIDAIAVTLTNVSKTFYLDGTFSTDDTTQTLNLQTTPFANADGTYEMNPLLLEYDDYDSVKYLVSSSLGLISTMKEETMPLRLVAYLPLLPLCVKRVIDKVKDNDYRINGMIEEHIEESLLQSPGDVNLTLMKDIISGREANLTGMDDDTIKISTRVYSFEQLDVFASINVIILDSMFFQVHKYYGNGLLRQYVYHHSKYVINKFDSNYRNLYKNPSEELENVQQSSLDDLSASKKMIRLLVAYSRIEVPLTPEHEQFIEM